MDAIIDPDQKYYRLAVSLYALRRKRDAIADRRGLFGEPGWDILLDLFIADRRRTEIQVSSVCLDAGVPSTTILRWIARLEAEGLIYRIADNADARRRYVRLTDEGRRMMASVLDGMGSLGSSTGGSSSTAAFFG
ncbi:MarR family transcriptional regulator [Novosphingobium sp. SL115]|uniref:MarR family winged helix-turn-helix transcriptional regulator n=1 Tax=Novosphingobium sp. SL115 TaxID=2995150 RepID=UPI002275A0FD|nr:MarR family transcriptional regulator [Novosphingobium sp. SL115]MCY1671419.1 MarR family transcriptional regulator [Novosphingobium sp. SL115]